LPGNERILISPGMVEMGGIIITPIGKDFDIVNEELIRTIYAEVSVDEETMQKILAALSF
jgi:formylmethanofuran dehydrogenase subunit A